MRTKHCLLVGVRNDMVLKVARRSRCTMHHTGRRSSEIDLHDSSLTGFFSTRTVFPLHAYRAVRAERMSDEPHKDTLHFLNTPIYMLHHTSVKHARWHLPTTTLLLSFLETPENDSFTMGETVCNIWRDRKDRSIKNVPSYLDFPRKHMA